MRLLHDHHSADNRQQVADDGHIDLVQILLRKQQQDEQKGQKADGEEHREDHLIDDSQAIVGQSHTHLFMRRHSLGSANLSRQ